VDPYRKDIDLEDVEDLQMVYEAQVPAILADMEDLFKLLAEVVDLKKSVEGKFLFNDYVLVLFTALVLLEGKKSLETLEESAPSIIGAVNSLDPDPVKSLLDSSTSPLKVFLNNMQPIEEAEFKFDNGKVLLQNASAIELKFSARSLLGIGRWIKSYERELEKTGHESEGSHLIQASRVGRIVVEQRVVELFMRRIYSLCLRRGASGRTLVTLTKI
jgi:hypothetical protein